MRGKKETTKGVEWRSFFSWVEKFMEMEDKKYFFTFMRMGRLIHISVRRFRFFDIMIKEASRKMDFVSFICITELNFYLYEHWKEKEIERELVH